MSKITLKQLLDLHGLEEGDEFTVQYEGGEYKVIDGNICRKLSNVGFVRCQIESQIASLVDTEVTITKKAQPRPKYGERYFTISSTRETWENHGLDEQNLENGLVFNNEGEADLRLEEMIKLWRQNQMLNSYATAYNSLKINAVSGTLIKSHPKSFFKVMDATSDHANHLFSESPKTYVDKVGYNYTYPELTKAIVLQVMLTGIDKRNLMVEVVLEKDYLEGVE